MKEIIKLCNMIRKKLLMLKTGKSVKNQRKGLTQLRLKYDLIFSQKANTKYRMTGDPKVKKEA